jgi:uncharacterized membrane protein
MQRQRESLLEAIVNFLLSFALMGLVLHFGYGTPWAESFAFGQGLALLTVIKTYLVRRFFAFFSRKNRRKR